MLRTSLRVLPGLLMAAWLLPQLLSAADLAVLVGKASSTYDQAVEGAASLPGVKVHRFDLHEGLTRVDEARDRLRRFPFTGILALGDAATSFLEGLRVSTPWKPLLPLNEVSGAYWNQLMGKLLPSHKAVHTLCPPEGSDYLRELQGSLRRSGRELVVHPTRPDSLLQGDLDAALPEDSVFLLWASPELMKRKVLVELLKVSHDRRVALLAFSRVLVDAGALASLEEEPASLGARSAALALGEEVPPPRILFHVNEKRAAFLGVSLPSDLANGSLLRLP